MVEKEAELEVGVGVEIGVEVEVGVEVVNAPSIGLPKV